MVRVSRWFIAPVLALGLTGCFGGSATDSAAVATADMGDVRFDEGATKLSKPIDYVRVGMAVQRLTQDPNVYVLVQGYTDASGNDQTNKSLSQARADYVAKLLMAGSGADRNRVISRGMGEAPGSKAGEQEHRRVELVFHYKANKDPEPDAEAILTAAQEREAAAAPVASAGKAPKAGKAAKGGGKGGEPAARKTIEETGLKEIDSLFAKVQNMLDLLYGATDKIQASSDKMVAAIGAGEGASTADALAMLKEKAAGTVKVKMEGTKPTISIDSSAPPEVKAAGEAMKQMVADMSAAVADLAQIPAQVSALINEAKALPGALPNMAKEAGLKPMEMLAVGKTLKNNIGALGSIPKAIADLGKTAAETFKAIGSAFA